jgi:adenylosuccinate synthase
MRRRRIPSITLVFGGQYGSESKGQILAAIVRDDNPEIAYAVRVGGCQAGHTARFADGKLHSVQSIPIPAFTHYNILPVIGAGGIINIGVLEKELKLLDEVWGKAGAPILSIDPNCMVVTGDHILEEYEKNKAGDDLCDKIGSTREGVGAALAAKIRRQGVKTVKDYPKMAKLPKVQVVDTVSLLNRSNRPIYVEGTQGHLLSINTSGFYPHTTSRQCGPMGILADIGISPFAARKFRSIAVFRTMPIRVGGNSGDLRYEVSWKQLKKESNGYISEPERTTVTNRIRRIARWDADRNLQTVMETRPTEMAIAFLDYMFPGIAEIRPSKCTDSYVRKTAWNWLIQQEQKLYTKLTYISTGPGRSF